MHWRCHKGHSWNSVIKSRVAGSGCPYCAGKKIDGTNSLEKLYPKIAKEWHFTKNKNLTPGDISSGSSRKVWWICSKGHEELLSVYAKVNRKKLSCLECSFLKNNNPKLFRQLHPTKNENLNIETLNSHGSQKVWWICSKGHEWIAQIYLRNKGQGCPYCSNRITTLSDSMVP